MSIRPLNKMLYTDLPIDELEGRLSMEELETRLELGCWTNICSVFHGECTVNFCPSRCDGQAQ